jgi:hypothetical protein
VGCEEFQSGTGSTLGNWVGLVDCWEFFWLRKIAVPDWEMVECACKYAGWSFWLMQGWLVLKFQFGTQSDYTSVLALIIESVQ